MDRFRHGKARLQPVAWHPRPRATRQFPLMLAHGRVLIEPGRKPNVTVVGKRNRVEREERFVLNPADAAAANLNEGDAAVGDDRLTASSVAAWLRCRTPCPRAWCR